MNLLGLEMVRVVLPRLTTAVAGREDPQPPLFVIVSVGELIDCC